MRRLVIVSDSALIVEAVRMGFRKHNDFELVGRAGARTTARTLVGAHPDVVLIDDVGRDERVLELIGELKVEAPEAAVIILGVKLDREWLGMLFDAGATTAISKATAPSALATLVRESVDGHVFHSFRGSDGRQLADDAATRLQLTEREREILVLVAAGETNGEVARRLWVTEQTVKFHLRNTYKKLGVENRTQASRFAHVNGLMDRRPSEPAAGELELAA